MIRFSILVSENPPFTVCRGEGGKVSLGSCGPAAVTGGPSKVSPRAQQEPAGTFSAGSLRFFLFRFRDFRLRILPGGHHSPNYPTVPSRSSEPRSNALPDPGWCCSHLPAWELPGHPICISHGSGPLCPSPTFGVGPGLAGSRGDKGCLLFISVSSPPPLPCPT